MALERSRGGGQAIRAITCLPALVGAWRHVGGGTVEMPIWEFPTRFDRICRPDWIKPGTRVINELDLGAALTGELALDPPVMSLFVYNSNPVSQAPSQAKIVKGLQREDLFTVVSELFVTDTARFADLILPATMQGEQYDLMVTWGHLYMMLNQPAIPAPGECIPNVELFRRLAKTMGFDDDYWDMTDDEMLLEFYDWSAPQLEGITLDLLKEKGWMRLNVGDPASARRTPRAASRRRRASASSSRAGRETATSSCRSGARCTRACSPATRSTRCPPTSRRSNRPARTRRWRSAIRSASSRPSRMRS